MALASVPVTIAEPLRAWLLDSDPALRWQVERDLLGEPAEVWRATRARVAGEGFGARLLALQDADGQWAGGAYFPAGHDFSDEGSGQPWTATTWTLNTLREWGLDSSALAGTAGLLARNSRWEYDQLPYWGGEVDCCINAYTLANGTWLGADVAGLPGWFVEHQLDDGGWNCEWVQGATRSSFHSTINSLIGLLAYESATGDSSVRMARKRGEEYLLSRRLMYRASDGQVVGPWVTMFSSPIRWHYSALKALDYFRAASAHDGVGPDPRQADAIDVVRAAMQSDGTWMNQHVFAGAVWFPTDAPEGAPSKWLTLYATRVLLWWDQARPSPR